MSQIILDAIAADVALLTREIDPPTGPLGYGSDLSCADDLTESVDEVDGSTVLALGQAIVRRLDCPRGGLPDASVPGLADRNYGMDLSSYCNRPTTTTEIRNLAGNIRQEVTKDDRIASVDVTVTPSPDGSSLAIDLHVTPVDPTLGQFAMTLSVTSAAVLLDAIRGGA